MRTTQGSLAMMFERLQFRGLSVPDLKPRFNVCPTQAVLTVRVLGEQAVAEELRWGLVPFWAKDLKIGSKMINARSETIASKPAFRTAFKSRRCLIVADGFYEWKKIGNEKRPHYICREDQQPYCMAGLWESWMDSRPSLFDDGKNGDNGDNGLAIETCTIITTNANEFMMPVHDRMPVVLDDVDQIKFWLDPDYSDRVTLEKMLVSRDWEEFMMYPVSQQVNFVRNDGPDLVVRIET